MAAKKTHKNQRGVTLIEIAIGLVILGLLITPLLAIYNAEKIQADVNGTYAKMRAVERAIESYVNTFDRYPMPASLTNIEGQPTYGIAFDSDGLTVPGNCPAAMGTVGTCLITEDDGGTALALAEEHLLIGMVPFGDIQVAEDLAYDEWGNRLLYVVTARQTQAAGSTFAGGTFVRAAPNGVELSALNTFTQNPVLLDTDSGALTQDYTDFDMILVSTGPSGKGGYNTDGTVVDVCVELGNPEYEDENCDFDNVFMIDQNDRPDPRPQGSGGTVNNVASSRFANGTRNFNDGPRFYDDLTREVRQISADIWNKNFNDDNIIVTSANRLGIGVQEPEHVLHVAGDLLVDDDPLTPAPLIEGRIVAEQLRDSSSTSSMPISLITGTDADMNCYEEASMGTNRVRPVINVGDSQTYCAQTSNSGGTGSIDPSIPVFEINSSVLPHVSNTCPLGERMTGLDASTRLVNCAVVP